MFVVVEGSETSASKEQRVEMECKSTTVRDGSAGEQERDGDGKDQIPLGNSDGGEETY